MLLRVPFFLRVRIAWVDSFIFTFLPSITRVLVWRFGFQTFLVWRCEKLTFEPNCLPLPVSSHFCIQEVILSVLRQIVKVLNTKSKILTVC